MLELLFVGAGPHCLTTLLRLLEPDPDTSIDTPRRRSHPKASVLRYHARQRSDAAHRRALSSWLRANVAVVDPAGCWMARWRAQFAGLGIQSLRSSSAVHPDPLDSYCLVTFAGERGRMGETQPLVNIHKSQDFHGPFHTPGARLFNDFTDDLISRYCLDDIVTKGSVTGLTPVFAPADSSSSSSSSSSSNSSKTSRIDHWLVDLAGGKQLTARRVIVGIGSTNRPRIPLALQHLRSVCNSSSRSSNSSSSSSRRATDVLSTSKLTPQHQQQPHHQQQLHQQQRDSQLCSSSSSGQGGPVPPLIPSSSASDCVTPRASSSTDSWQLLSSCPDSPRSCSSCWSDSSQGSATGDGDACYPVGRLMHAWELAAAAAGPCAQATTGSTTTTAATATAPLEQRGLLQPGEHIVIIGGGLTSAHLAQLALQQQPHPSSPAAGSRRVTLLMRGEWRVKQFDVTVDFMGRHRGRQLGRFRELHSIGQRLALMRDVLQGGSMPPEAAAGLHQLQRSGLLEVRQHASLVAADWDWQESQWQLFLADGGVLAADRLWLATGSTVDATAEPLLAGLLRQLPVAVESGLPAIQPSLEWAAGSGLYLLGAYAALALGPGALNLAGAKTASTILEKQLLPQLQHALPPGRTWRAAAIGGGGGGGVKPGGAGGSGGSNSTVDQCGDDRLSSEASLMASHKAAEQPAGQQGDTEQLQGAANSKLVCTAPQGSRTLCLTAHARGQRQQQAADCCGACWKSRALQARSGWSSRQRC